MTDVPGPDWTDVPGPGQPDVRGPGQPNVRGPSRTAVLVAQGRAAAHDRLARGRFSDPVAYELLRPEERVVVDRVRSEVAPVAWRDRWEYQLVAATAVVMAARTVMTDDALRSSMARQVVILGAGLDARAWRMRELSRAMVFEVDHPASQADLLSRLGDRAAVARKVRFVSVDFTRDRLGDALGAAGHDSRQATTWISEGVVPYLTRAQVEDTLAEIAACSVAGSRIILNYETPSTVSKIGRLVVRGVGRPPGRAHPLAREPLRSTWTPARMRKLLGRHQFVVHSDENLVSFAGGSEAGRGTGRSLRNGRVAVGYRS